MNHWTSEKSLGKKNHVAFEKCQTYMIHSNQQQMKKSEEGQ